MENIDYPLFTYHPNRDYFICLVKDGHGGYCSYKYEGFQNLIEHFATNHGLSFKKNVDFCCENLFESKLDALDHFLSHICNLEEKELRLEPYTTIDLKLRLSDFFDVIKAQRDEIMKKLLFDDELKIEEDVVDFFATEDPCDGPPTNKRDCTVLEQDQ